MLSRQQRLDAESDREYLMGKGRWRDDGDFVAHRPHMISLRFLLTARRRRRARTKSGRVDPLCRPTYVYVMHPEAHRPSEAEREHIDRFFAAFVLKKSVAPAGHWKVPGVGYCVFYRSPLPHLEQLGLAVL